MRRTLLIAVLSIASAAIAQDATRPKSAQAPRPPVITGDPALEPEITIIQKEGAKVEEYRLRGKLFAMKVTPSAGPPYWLIDERGDGQFIRRDNLDTGLRVPQWVIMTF